MANSEASPTSILGNGNTAPFISVALGYCLLISLPFIIFLLIQASSSGPQGEKTIPGWLSETTYVVIVRLALFSAVLCFGALGSAISLISRVRNGEALLPVVTVHELISVQTIGAVFALVLSLIFMGNLIAGSIFPSWDPFYTIVYSPPAFAKLLVWSFIAGFFERFVPHMLDNLSKRADEQEDEPPRLPFPQKRRIRRKERGGP